MYIQSVNYTHYCKATSIRKYIVVYITVADLGSPRTPGVDGNVQHNQGYQSH